MLLHFYELLPPAQFGLKLNEHIKYQESTTGEVEQTFIYLQTVFARWR